MAIDFGDLNGEAKKGKVEYMKLADGDNKFRIVGGILPGYSYWVKNSAGKDMPFECLQFDRNTERFNSSLPDPIQEAGLVDAKGEPLRCSWAYRCQVINRATGKLCVLQLKKGMLQDLISLAKRRKVNVTDYDNGCDIVVTREKTGPKAFNVKYSVDPYCLDEPSPLSDADRELIKDLKPMEELFPLETPEEQRVRLEKHLNYNPNQDDSKTKEDISDL